MATTVVGSASVDQPLKKFRDDAQSSMTDDEYAQWQSANAAPKDAAASYSFDPATQTWTQTGGAAPTTQSYSFDPSTQTYSAAPTPESLNVVDRSPQPGAQQPGALQPRVHGTPLNRSDYQVPGYDQLLSQLQNRTAGIAGRTTDSDARQGQMALAQQLGRYASGQDSVSALQLRQALEQQQAQQMAMAAGARPGSAQLASLAAAQNIGTAGTALAGQQATAGIQERLAAQQALSGVLGQTRGQDISLGGQNDTAYQQALAQQLGLAQMQQQGGQAYSTNRQQQQLAQQQLQQQLAIAQMNNATQMAIAQGQKPSTWDKILGTGLGLGSYALMGGLGGGGGGGTDFRFGGGMTGQGDFA